jgi:hypothetical protein
MSKIFGGRPTDPNSKDREGEGRKGEGMGWEDKRKKHPPK